MPKELIFFCCACCILVLTIINLSVGPIISGTVGRDWGTNNCAKLVDDYDIAKKGSLTEQEKKYDHEWPINECKRKKGMHDMEYTAFIFDIVIGFVCGLLGLLHLSDIGNDFKSKTGLIGLVCGIIGFILTFVYVIFNGIVYTNYYDNNYNFEYKRESDGAFAERIGVGKYKCIYFDEEGNEYSFIAKYSDLIQKQYNYNKDFADEDSKKITNCRESPSVCYNKKEYSYLSERTYEGSNPCEKLYVNLALIQSITNKDKSDRFLTTLLLSLFVCLANIGLIIFGFLLFKN